MGIERRLGGEQVERAGIYRGMYLRLDGRFAGRIVLDALCEVEY
jgi:hypothetical protein